MTRFYDDYISHDNLYNSEFLEHHGILGMHWGDRRYQNKDGSLTNAGRQRYGVKQALHDHSVKKKRKKALKKAQAARKAKAKQVKKNEKIRELARKDPVEMYKHRDLFTTAELNGYNSRFDAEQKMFKQAEAKKNQYKTRVDTALGYLTTAQNAYKMLSSNEIQVLTRAINDKYGTNIPTLPGSLQQYEAFKKLSEEKKKKG